jgi:hypothetical protein
MSPADHLAHLVRRFAGSLSPRPPSGTDDAWARAWLAPDEIAVWERMPNPDKRHAVAVARAVAGSGESRRPVVAAALLHDCGKVACGLGTLGRAGATVWVMVVGEARAGQGDGRVTRYVLHEAIGAAMLRDAGSDPVTVALVGRTADAPVAALAALAAADDAI